MKPQLLYITAIAVSTTVIGFSLPARAFDLNPSDFGNNIIEFNTDTSVEFDFLDSHTAAQAAFGIYTKNGQLVNTLLTKNLGKSDTGNSSNDWEGSCGKTVSVCTSIFTFKAGVDYTFGLRNYNPNQPNIINNPYSFGNDVNKALFVYGGSFAYSTVGGINPSKITNTTPGLKTLTVGSNEVLIALEDGTDNDYNDFIMKASVVSNKKVSVPEPTSILALIGSTLVGLVSVRRRAVRKMD